MKKATVKRIPLTGALAALIGTPECRGSWFFWGESGNGKTTLIMQICKVLAHLGYKVDYNSLEEEDRGSMTDLLAECKMEDCPNGKFILLTGWTYEELIARLKQPRSARVIVIDSVQYFNINKTLYKALVAMFPTKLFIFNSHAEGRKPVGAIGRDIKFDADVKFWVEGFRAFSRSRMSRGKVTQYYTIWADGAADYWDKILK